MEDFSKQQEIEREMSYYELFQRLMNGNHSAQMVNKVNNFTWNRILLSQMHQYFFQEINGVPISKQNPKLVLKLFFSSLIFVGDFHEFFKIIFLLCFDFTKKFLCNFLSVMFDVTVVIAEDVVFNWFILFLLFLIGTINVLILVMLAKFPQTRTVGFAAPLGKF